MNWKTRLAAVPGMSLSCVILEAYEVNKQLNKTVMSGATRKRWRKYKQLLHERLQQHRMAAVLSHDYQQLADIFSEVDRSLCVGVKKHSLPDMFYRYKRISNSVRWFQ